MYVSRAILLSMFLMLTSAENALRRYESECRAELGSILDPCQRACELEKLGVMENGTFDIHKTMLVIDQPDGLKMYPDHRSILLKAAFHTCHREISPAQSLDKCSAAAAMYYCVSVLLQPEDLYREENGRRQKEDRSVPCKCPKKGFKGSYGKMEGGM